MSAARRAASVVVVVFAIGVAAKAVHGGKKGPEKSGDGEKTPAPPVTLPANPDPGGPKEKPLPIRTGGET